MSDFAHEMGRAADAIIAAVQAGQLDLAHYRIGALVGMTEAADHRIEVNWDDYDASPLGTWDGQLAQGLPPYLHQMARDVAHLKGQC